MTRSAHPADSTSRSPEAGDDQAGLAGPQARQVAMELDYELRNSFERALSLFQFRYEHGETWLWWRAERQSVVDRASVLGCLSLVSVVSPPS